VLRIGHHRDALVPVQADSPASLQLARRLFAPWIDDTVADDLADTTPAFAVHLTSSGPARGRRSLPHLRAGREVLARSHDPNEILHALAYALGGLHERTPDDDRSWVHLRAFTRGERIVLADVHRPHLLADRELERDGIAELVHTGVELVEPTMLVVPPPLQVDWAAEGVPAPTGHHRHELCGAVVLGHDDPTPAETLARLSANSTSGQWFTTCADLIERGCVRTVRDRAGARTAVQALLR